MKQKDTGYYYSFDDKKNGDVSEQNASWLEEENIYSYNSTKVRQIENLFREKISNGETLYLVGLQAIMHDSGVSLVEVSKDGFKLLANNEEERFSGIKHHAGYPQLAVKELIKQLESLGKTTKDIFAVFYGWDLSVLERSYGIIKKESEKFGLSRNVIDDYILVSSISDYAKSKVLNEKERRNENLWSSMLIDIRGRLVDDMQIEGELPLIQMLHHENHAYLAYGLSPFSNGINERKETMIACMDGSGDSGASSFFMAKNGKLSLKKRSSFSDSVGYFYGLLSTFLGGWSVNNAEGRYMGATAWGNNSRLTNRHYKRLRQYFHFEAGGGLYSNQKMVKDNYRLLEEVIGPFCRIDELWNPNAIINIEKIRHSKITQDRVDKAAAVQMVFEDAVFHMIGNMIEETKADQLVLCGGAALNCIANMKLVEMFNEEYYLNSFNEQKRLKIWIPPLPSDQGVIAGAPIQFAMKNSIRSPGRLSSPFICGMSPKTKSIKHAIGEVNFVDYLYVGNVHEDVARDKLTNLMAYIVSKNGVLGVFQGPGETGPRALGHRSILSNPCNRDTLKILNERVKFRERIRPLAPMVTLEEAPKWFNLSLGASEDNYSAYDYMVLTATVREEARLAIPAVIHKDRTSRIQIVRKKNNLVVYEYLKQLKKYIGVEVSVNTSLNIGSPIVQTPDQALYLLKKATGIDCIVMIGDEGEVFLVWAKEEVHGVSPRLLQFMKDIELQ